MEAFLIDELLEVIMELLTKQVTKNIYGARPSEESTPMSDSCVMFVNSDRRV